MKLVLYLLKWVILYLETWKCLILKFVIFRGGKWTWGHGPKVKVVFQGSSVLRSFIGIIFNSDFSGVFQVNWVCYFIKVWFCVFYEGLNLNFVNLKGVEGTWAQGPRGPKWWSRHFLLLIRLFDCLILIWVFRYLGVSQLIRLTILLEFDFVYFNGFKFAFL